MDCKIFHCISGYGLQDIHSLGEIGLIHLAISDKGLFVKSKKGDDCKTINECLTVAPMTFAFVERNQQLLREGILCQNPICCEQSQVLKRLTKKGEYEIRRQSDTIELYLEK